MFVGDCDDNSVDAVCGELSPDALVADGVMLLSPRNLVALVVDDAHCIRKWLLYMIVKVASTAA